MRIKVIEVNKKDFLVEDILNNIQFKIPKKTLIVLLKLNPNILTASLVDRTYKIETHVNEE